MDDQIKINGLDETQISAIFKALIVGNKHPQYFTALEMATQFASTHDKRILDSMTIDPEEAKRQNH